MPAAVGATADVRAIGGPAVGREDQRLGHRRQGGDGAVAVVDACLRIGAEAAVLRRAVSGVRADDGEALGEGARRARAGAVDEAGGRHDVAVDAAVALVEEAPVPGLRQAHLEADRVALAVDRAGPLVHHAGDAAMRADRHAGCRQLARRHPRRRGDEGARMAERAGERLAGGQGRALRRRERRRGGEAGAGGQHAPGDDERDEKRARHRHASFRPMDLVNVNNHPKPLR